MARIKISVTLDQSLVRELDRLSAGSSRSEIVERALGGWMRERRRVTLEDETMRGKPIATVTAVPRGADWESIAIGSNPKFLEIMERSRVAHRRRGGLSPDEMRRQLGIEPRSKAKRKR